MAFDEGLAERLRELTANRQDVQEKRMFGGLCFMVRNHMCIGIVDDTLMVRVGPDQYAHCLTLPHAREMDFTGRAMKGLVYVAPEGIENDDDLAAWIQRAIDFVTTLPPK